MILDVNHKAKALFLSLYFLNVVAPSLL